MKAKLMGLVAVGGLMLGAASANADVLGQYSFTGARASGGASAGQPDGGTLGGTLNVFNVGNSGATPISAGTDDFRAGSWSTAALVDTEHFVFSYTPTQSGVSLTSIQFTVSRPGTNGPVDVTVRGSLSGTTALFNYDGAGGGGADDDANPDTHTANLTGAYSNLTANSAVTFQIFGHDADSNANSALWAIDNVIVNGTLGEIPEPASIGVLGLAGMALLRRRQA